ncbi:microfibril-associated glycoprotein 4-like [Drosophila willistoni]|uniref:microfibril-associated glycoprotein 4-like n=1 Tax=Drosophila willistoni TaxID=7260 RepID=UPI001F080107|nr:microfibril-associated glycoprotein 4-like [Drosophila willistoni]
MKILFTSVILYILFQWSTATLIAIGLQNEESYQWEMNCFRIVKPMINYLTKVEDNEELRKKIINLEKRVERYEVQFKDQENQLKTKDTLLNEKSAEFQQQLKAKDDILLAKEEKFEAQKTLLDAKEEQIMSLSAQVTKYTVIIEDKDLELKKCKQQEEIFPFSVDGIRRLQIAGQASFEVPYVSPLSGWTVIQRRIDGEVSFNRDWIDYKNGFGDMQGNFFIGLEKLHLLTLSQPHELYIQLRDVTGNTKYARYDNLIVAGEKDNYMLQSIGKYTGTAGDSLTDHVGHMFTTKDKDNDVCTDSNCAAEEAGGWWYEDCAYSRLNGKYDKDGISSNHNGIAWGSWSEWNYTISLTFAQMMIRPSQKVN